MSGRPKIVLLGMMTKIPVAGVVWQTIHYLVGFQRLGFDAYYVEAHARTPGMLMRSEGDDSGALGASFVADVMERFGLAGRWAYQALHDDGRVYGMGERELSRLFASAELIVNLHGGTEPRPEHYETGRLVYLETDPVQLQVELYDEKQHTLDFLEPHVAFFTFGENYGRPGCGLPVSDRFTFHPTRQPVVTDFWLGGGADSGRYTTVGNWSQSWRDVTYDGERYGWSKDREFRRFLALPSRTGRSFELALSSYSDAGSRAAREPRLECAERDGILDRRRRLPQLPPRLAGRVHGGQGPERPPADGLVQRPRGHVPRRRPTRRHPGHGLRRGAADRGGALPVHLDRRRGLRRRDDRGGLPSRTPGRLRARPGALRRRSRPRPAARDSRRELPGRRRRRDASGHARPRPGLAAADDARARDRRGSGERPVPETGGDRLGRRRHEASVVVVAADGFPSRGSASRACC